MSAIMKTFFDRLSDLLKIRKPLGRRLRGKTMWVISSSSDAAVYPSFLKAFELSAAYLGMQYGGNLWGWIEEGTIPSSLEDELNRFTEKLNFKMNSI